MTTEKTDNEIIAEFMGAREIGGLGFSIWMGGHWEYFFKYHTSWDWLMPVVLKIRLVLNDNDLYEKSKERNFWDVIQFSFQAVSIEATYFPVVEFIKWYNTQPKNVL